MKLPLEKYGEGLKGMIVHEVGHILGFGHNLPASHAYPTDSLRSATFTQKYGITQENTKNVIKIEENVCKTQESDSKTQESAQEVPESVIIPGKNETGNPLIDAELQSKIVGDSLMAYIEVDKDTLKGISEEEYRAFAEEVVRNSGYRWFVIKCGDGTGIVHAGSYYACAVYGKLDTDGCIAEPYGYIYLTDNGFIYEE